MLDPKHDCKMMKWERDKAKILKENFMARSGNTIQINISVPKDLHAKIKEAAKADNRSVSNFVAGIIDKAIRESSSANS